jgi:hypothetical protein
MTETQSFGVFVRSFGLILFIYGIYAGIYLLMNLSGIKMHYSVPNSGAILSALWIVIGVVLMRNADPIVRFAYPVKE